MNRRDEAPRRVDAPEAGRFKLRMTRGGPWVPAEIIFDGACWSARIDGMPAGAPHSDPAEADSVYFIWTRGVRIDDSEFAYLIELGRWARENAPEHPAAKPDRSISLTQLRSLF